MNPFALAEQLPDDTAALQALAARQRDRIAALEQQLAWFTEQYRLAQHRRFGAARETSSSQLELFAALCAAAQQAASDATALADLSVQDGGTNAHDKSPSPRRHRGRPALPPNVPREAIVHDVPDADKRCPCCGERKQRIGERRSEQLDIVPRD